MEDSTSVSSVERIVKIVSAIAESDRSVGVTALAQQLDMPKATVFRFCNTLAELNVLNKNENDEFSLGLIFVTLGEQVKASSSPAMLWPSRNTGLPGFSLMAKSTNTLTSSSISLKSL